MCNLGLEQNKGSLCRLGLNCSLWTGPTKSTILSPSIRTLVNSKWPTIIPITLDLQLRLSTIKSEEPDQGLKMTKTKNASESVLLIDRGLHYHRLIRVILVPEEFLLNFRAQILVSSLFIQQKK